MGRSGCRTNRSLVQTPHSLDHTIALLALAALFGLGTGALHAAVEALAAADDADAG